MSDSNAHAFPFQNPALPIAERVDDLVSRLTLREKAAQMLHESPALPHLGIPAAWRYARDFRAKIRSIEDAKR